MFYGGLKPHTYSHRDYDFLKTKKLGAVLSFPENYSVDANLWMPNQNLGSDLFTPPVPPMPYGCTNYSQCDLAADQDGQLYDPSYLESITHANENRGAQLRDSMQAVVDHGLKNQKGEIVTGNHPAYFNVRPSRQIDFFDAVRLAMLSASNEKRGVSVGSPWWLHWGRTGSDGIVPLPDFNLDFATWHNWNVKGWKTINGEPYLVGKPWAGSSFGDGGFVYISRSFFNATMSVRGSVAFTLDKLMPGESVATVDWDIVAIIVNYVRRLFNV